MNERDKQRIVERYNERVRECGANVKGLASGSEDHREIRFGILTEVGMKSGDRILDVGCGFGDFFGFCAKNQIEIDYLGIDINPGIIAEARKRFPNARFEVKDLQSDHLDPVDYVVSTSSFNLLLEGEDNYSFVEDILKRSFELAGKGVAIDFLTEHVDFKASQEAFYYAPDRVFNMAKRLTKRVALRHDYPLYEFCVYLYPDFRGWKQE